MVKSTLEHLIKLLNMNHKENEQIHPVIQQAIDNNFYGFNIEDFFLKKIIKTIQQSRKGPKFSNKSTDRDLLRGYFDSIAENLVPTQVLLENMSFIANPKNNDLAAELKNNIHKIFSTKFLLWSINNANVDLARLLSSSIKKQIDLNHYPIEEVIDNLSIIKDEKNKDIFLSEVLLTKNAQHYALLRKSIELSTIQENNIIENILASNNDSMLLNREKIKNIIVKTVNEKQWKVFDNQIRILSINKLDFLLDILLEAKNEAQLDKNKENVNTAIYKLLDKALYTKKEELIERVLDIKQEQPTITGIDMYVLMTKRFYSYMKKEKAQQYFKKLLEVAKVNGEFNEVKSIFFSNIDKYTIKSLSVEVNFQDSYLNKEMKMHFMNYLEEKMPAKNTQTKPIKI